MFLAVATVVESDLTPLNTYKAYNELEEALLNGNTSSVPNLHVLVDTFFPKQGLEPICAPVKFTLMDADEDGFDWNGTNHSFLWTDRYLPYTTGILLLSYSRSGITLKGFEWERACLFMNETVVVLELNSSFNYSNDDIVNTLGDLASQV